MSVARPGLYDLGALRLDAGVWSVNGTMSHAGEGPPERRELLRKAVAGTGWARFLPDRR